MPTLLVQAALDDRRSKNLAATQLNILLAGPGSRLGRSHEADRCGVGHDWRRLVQQSLLDFEADHDRKRKTAEGH